MHWLRSGLTAKIPISFGFVKGITAGNADRPSYLRRGALFRRSWMRSCIFGVETMRIVALLWLALIQVDAGRAAAAKLLSPVISPPVTTAMESKP